MTVSGPTAVHSLLWMLSGCTSQLQPPPLTDYAFVTGGVALENATLTFNNLVMTNGRKFDAFGLDAIATGNNSHVVIQHSTLLDLLCVTPPEQTLQAALSLPDLSGYPPKDVRLLPDKYCVWEPSEAVSGTNTTGYNHACFDRAIHFSDLHFMVNVTDEGSSGARPGYALHLHNVTRVCRNYLDHSCLQRAGGNLTYCWYLQAFELLPELRPPAGSDGGNSTQPSLLPPSTIAGIAVGVLLGAGSFGRVYKGRWHSKDVAVKVINCQPRDLDVVLREADVMMKLQHEYVVKCLSCQVKEHHSGRARNGPAAGGTTGSGKVAKPNDFWDQQRPEHQLGQQEGQAEVQVWLVLELCNGGSLQDTSRPTTRFDMARLVCRLQEVARGMEYLHSQGIMHGDLKAANVLLTNSIYGSYGQVTKLSDFGLASLLAPGATHRSTQRMGTITHQAPEVLERGHQSPAADVYSFGIMMWELFTGSSAFRNLHYGAVVQRVVVAGERPPLPAEAPDAYCLLMTQ
eukprot:gene5331-5567_t